MQEVANATGWMEVGNLDKGKGGKKFNYQQISY